MVTKRSLSSKRSSNKKGESLLYGNKKDVRGKKKEIENVLAPRPEWRDCFGIIQLSEDDLSELKESKRDWNIFQKWREEKRIGFWNGTVWISDMDSKAYKWFEKVLGGGFGTLGVSKREVRAFNDTGRIKRGRGRGRGGSRGGRVRILSSILLSFHFHFYNNFS